jgi:hypothetical protein
LLKLVETIEKIIEEKIARRTAEYLYLARRAN